MDDRLGQLLEGARTRLALSQGALASLLEVTQQTVSRWEQGSSRPRPKMIASLAEVLNLDVDEFMAAAGTRALSDAPPPQADDSLGKAAPVRPLTPLLPFQLLTAEQFERVIADLMERRYPGANVSQLGGQGDDQRGYDILVVRPDGRRVGVQCKRERQFGPKKVEKAVLAAELGVDESFIALSRVATAEARFEMDKHAGWQLWDRADLSRQVRLLDIEAAHQVVRTYFPGHVEAFLGIKPASPWRTAEEFYRSSANTLLDHRQALVGREKLVNEVVQWVNDPDGTEIATLIGRGGLGKSKLLWEVANRTDGAAIHVRFLAIGQQPVASDFDHLPRSGRLVVGLDDAHAIDHVAGIVAQLWQTHPTAKVVLATRPYGEVELDAEIWKLNQSPRTTERWVLDDLTQAEAVELVSNLTSRPVHDPFTRQLAAISHDCPFIAVVAADLYRRGKLSGTSFVSDAALRQDIFRRFADQMTGQVGGTDAIERRSVLSALAMFQPVRLDDSDFEDAITQLTGLASWDLVNGRIRELEDAGLVLRRGTSAVRVVPDMFADVLVASAAFDDRSGRPTSFLARAQRAATGAPLQHFLVNASRIDWQVRDGGPGRADIVDGLWGALRDQLNTGTYDEQLSLLELVTRIAYLQPDLALQFVDAVLAPDDNTLPAADPAVRRWAATRADVVHATVPVLQNIAYHSSFLKPALDRLWSLAQDDGRPTNQHPEHPLRVLKYIADLRTGKPFVYIEAVIDTAASWFDSPSQLSPFDVLEPILAVEGSDEISSDLALTFHSFAIDPASVHDVRQRVVDLAFDQAAVDDVRAAVRAIKALEQAIQFPVGMFGRQVSQAELDGWAAEFVPIIERLGRLGADPDRDPAIRLAIRESLSWHADHSEPAARTAAKTALSLLVGTLEDELAACLHADWDRMAMRPGLSFGEAQAAQAEQFRKVAEAISKDHTSQEVLDHLERRLHIERLSCERLNGSARFLAEFFTVRPSAATLLCQQAVAGGLPELSAFASVAMGIMANAGNARVMEFASAMLASDNDKLQWAAASGLSWNRAGRAGVLPGEADVLSAMACHDSDAVRTMAGRAAFFIGMSDKAAALNFIAKIEFRGSPKVAAGALSGFVPQGPLRWSDTSAPLRKSILRQLLEVVSIDEYEITSALSELSRLDPMRVTRLLRDRIDRQTELQGMDYHALPSHWEPALRVHETTKLARCLVEVRDWMTRRGHDRRTYYLQDDGSDLYKLIAGDWSDQALATLSDVGDNPTEAALVTAARILAHAPTAVLYARVPLVAKLLHHAESLGKDSGRLVFHALLPTNHGAFTTWVGDRPKKEERELTEARRIAGDLPRGSIERQFFQTLADAFQDRLNWTADRPRPRHDGRDW
jgi:transcriptional regulator with XRE-family HTH domain